MRGRITGLTKEGYSMRMLLGLCVLATATSLAFTDDRPDKVAAVRKAIAAQNAKYAKAVTKRDLRAFMALFTDDATVMQVGKSIKSKKEREAAAKNQFASVTESVLETNELDVRGDLAYEVGKYTVTAREGREKASGSYLVIWKRQKGGEWLIHIEATLPGGTVER